MYKEKWKHIAFNRKIFQQKFQTNIRLTTRSRLAEAKELYPNEQGMPTYSTGRACWILKSSYCWLLKSNSPMPCSWNCFVLQRNSTKDGLDL